MSLRNLPYHRCCVALAYMLCGWALASACLAQGTGSPAAQLPASIADSLNADMATARVLQPGVYRSYYAFLHNRPDTLTLRRVSYNPRVGTYVFKAADIKVKLKHIWGFCYNDTVYLAGTQGGGAVPLLSLGKYPYFKVGNQPMSMGLVPSSGNPIADLLILVAIPVTIGISNGLALHEGIVMGPLGERVKVTRARVETILRREAPFWLAAYHTEKDTRATRAAYLDRVNHLIRDRAWHNADPNIPHHIVAPE